MTYFVPQLPPPPKPNAGLSFLGFTGGALILLVIGVLVLPVVALVLCCVGGALVGSTTDPSPSPSRTATVSPAATR
ncbi:heat shock protein 70 [Micromonospora sp. L5]|uniref:hypothetical protein n=1 Tax=Micromonospora sp. (strain L5) TaxID=648999 RepID=UPI0001C465CB|nr:hypothetical protein [Micromonospora sp. L5]ADU06929.1 heat shock protein 70 [Micromonospora sp. L5]